LDCVDGADEDVDDLDCVDGADEDVDEGMDDGEVKLSLVKVRRERVRSSSPVIVRVILGLTPLLLMMVLAMLV